MYVTMEYANCQITWFLYCVLRFLGTETDACMGQLSHVHVHCILYMLVDSQCCSSLVIIQSVLL